MQDKLLFFSSQLYDSNLDRCQIIKSSGFFTFLREGMIKTLIVRIHQDNNYRSKLPEWLIQTIFKTVRV